MQATPDSQSVHSDPTANSNTDTPVILNEKPDVDPFLVTFSPGDPENPMNWSNAKKWYLTMVGALLVFAASFASTVSAPVSLPMRKEFGFSQEVATLTISLFVCGFCVGPLLWGPLSEQYGRRPIFIVSFFGFLCFQIGSALANNTASVLIFRFLGGTFAACPLANSGALMADIWGPRERGTALAIFIIGPFAGPGVGPVVGGYMYEAGVPWRWVFWVLAIFSGACCLQVLLTIPETYAPVLLVRMAREKRKITGDERYYAAIEKDATSFVERLEVTLGRPFKILFLEPILIALTLYMSFVFGCVYLLFDAYPLVYTKGHHLRPGPAGLVYLPLPIGSVISVVVYLLFVNKAYLRKLQECAPAPVPPEYRLPMAMIAAPLYAVSFFWFAWTSYSSISIWVPLVSSVVMAFCICWIFFSLINYIVDVYLFHSASALAANVVVRSLFGAGFPLFATQMYNKLGLQWASTLVAFIALLMTPVPFILWKYGPAIRARSKFAPQRPPPKMTV